MKKIFFLSLISYFALSGVMAQNENSLKTFEFETSTDNNYTGRGNTNEVLLKGKLHFPTTLTFSNITIDLTGTTNLSDIEKIKIYIYYVQVVMGQMILINLVVYIVCIFKPMLLIV